MNKSSTEQVSPAQSVSIVATLTFILSCSILLICPLDIPQRRPSAAWVYPLALRSLAMLLDKRRRISELGLRFCFMFRPPPHGQWNGVCRDCGRYSPGASESLQRHLNEVDRRA